MWNEDNPTDSYKGSINHTQSTPACSCKLDSVHGNKISKMEIVRTKRTALVTNGENKHEDHKPWRSWVSSWKTAGWQPPPIACHFQCNERLHYYGWAEKNDQRKSGNYFAITIKTLSHTNCLVWPSNLVQNAFFPWWFFIQIQLWSAPQIIHRRIKLTVVNDIFISFFQLYGKPYTCYDLMQR